MCKAKIRHSLGCPTRILRSYALVEYSCRRIHQVLPDLDLNLVWRLKLAIPIFIIANLPLPRHSKVSKIRVVRAKWPSYLCLSW